MKKQIGTIIIILTAVILVTFGILMPNIAFSYQNDSLLTQVDSNQMDEISFSNTADNSLLNTLQFISSNDFYVISDDRDSDIDLRKSLKDEVTYVLNTLYNYSNEYSEKYGYKGNTSLIKSSRHYLSPKSCVITSSDFSDSESYLLENNEVLLEIISKSGTSGNNYSDITWDDRAAWIVTSNERLDHQDLLFLIDDTSQKVIGFYIYDEMQNEEVPFTMLDVNEYTYDFTNLITDYYGLDVLYSQSEIEESWYYYDNEQFDYFWLYFTVVDPSSSDVSVVISVYVSIDSIYFNLFL